MKKTAVIIFVLAISLSVQAAKGPNFGKDGLKGLSSGEKKALAKGKIVFSTIDKKGKEKSALIQAAIVFNKSPEETYKILYRTENQVKYLDEIDKIKVLSKSPTKDNLEFKLSVMLITKIYRVVHHFDKKNRYIYWYLDKGFKKNDLNELRGFWKFYPYGDGKTLARYGSNVSIKYVPEFIENMFKKNGVKKSLRAVRKYVNSGGTYHK